MIIQKGIRYLQWMVKESRDHSDPRMIYNWLAQNGVYENIINYPLRVRILKKAFDNMTFGKYVLDLASGTGAFIEALPNKDELSITGTDISEGMLNVAKKRFKRYSNVSFKLVDLITIDFPDNKFDLITISYSTRFIFKQNEIKFIKKVVSMLKREGLFIVVIMNEPYKRIVKNVRHLVGSKGPNDDMETESYLIERMKPYLNHVASRNLGQQFFIFTSRALYFKNLKRTMYYKSALMI